MVLLDEADFYPIFGVNGHWYTGATDTYGHDDFITSDWLTLVPIAMDKKSVRWTYEIWDDDNPGATDDDQCDIWNGEDQKVWVADISTDFPIDVQTDGRNGPSDLCLFLTGGTGFECSSGDGDEAYANFNIQFFSRTETYVMNLNKDKVYPEVNESVTFTANIMPQSKNGWVQTYRGSRVFCWVDQSRESPGY